MQPCKSCNGEKIYSDGNICLRCAGSGLEPIGLDPTHLEPTQENLNKSLEAAILSLIQLLDAKIASIKLSIRFLNIIQENLMRGQYSVAAEEYEFIVKNLQENKLIPGEPERPE